MRKMSEYVFGDYSGLREYARSPGQFLDSFVQPESFSIDTLRNSANFIIIGRKGSGKSSCCVFLADKKKETHSARFFNFSEDLTRSDLKDAVATQAINLSDVSVKRLFDSIVEFCDFRDLWVRKVINEIAKKTIIQGREFRICKIRN